MTLNSSARFYNIINFSDHDTDPFYKLSLQNDIEKLVNNVKMSTDVELSNTFKEDVKYSVRSFLSNCKNLCNSNLNKFVH